MNDSVFFEPLDSEKSYPSNAAEMRVGYELANTLANIDLSRWLPLFERLAVGDVTKVNVVVDTVESFE